MQNYLLQWIISITARANILIHIVPVEVLQFLGGEIDARHLICIVLWRLKTIPIVDVDRWIWMSGPEPCHRNHRLVQYNFMENSADRQQILFGWFAWRYLNDRRSVTRIIQR